MGRGEGVAVAVVVVFEEKLLLFAFLLRFLGMFLFFSGREEPGTW